MDRNSNNCKYTDYEGKDMEQEVKDFQMRCTICMAAMVKNKDKNPPLWEAQE